MKRAITEGWVDSTLPDLADLLPEGFDVAWLGSQLGRYRASELERQTAPTHADDVRYLQKTCEALRTARDLLEELPPAGEAEVHSLFPRWQELCARLRTDLELAESAMEMGADTLALQPGKRGRPEANSRAVLLAALCGQLRATPMTAAAARRLAEAILIRCRVPVPETANDQRAMRRAAKVKGQE